jgi:hypothetical protein
MNDAREMLFSRDPHLAAIGLYWMPLPTVGQLPFMLLLSPLHHAELSGPLADAFCGALTVLVLAWVAWSLELSKPVSVLITASYALTPIVAYTNGNGMSEAWSFLGLAITMLGFVRWSKDHRPLDLALLAGGLAVVALVRYEALALAPMMATIAAINDGQGPPSTTSLRSFAHDVQSRIRRWTTTAAIVCLPTFFVFALWMIMNLVIARNALYFYDLQKQVTHTSKGAYINLPAHTAAAILGYCLNMTVFVVPAMLVLTPLLLIRRRYHDVITGLGIAAAGLIWPAIVVLGIFANQSAGAPRYFEPAVVPAAVGAMWLASSLPGRGSAVRRLVGVGMVGILVFSAIVGTIGLENPLRTNIEQENHFFSPLLGHHLPPLPPTALSHAVVWKQLANDLDTQLRPGNKVIVDVSTVAFGAFLYTRYPDSYIVNSDRDYTQIIANPDGRFDYLILPSSQAASGGDLGTEYPQLLQILGSTTQGHWVKWKSYFVGTIYRFIPNLRGPGA